MKELEPAKQRRLNHEEKMAIVMELAVGKKSGLKIAADYGISDQRVSQIKKEYEQTISTVRSEYLDHVSAEAIKNQEWRLFQYARDLEKLDGTWHPEWVKARSQILKNVADELGQAVPKTQITIRPTEHVLIGVDIETDL